jgi:hypothetical protein
MFELRAQSSLRLMRLTQGTVDTNGREGVLHGGGQKLPSPQLGCLAYLGIP